MSGLPKQSRYLATNMTGHWAIVAMGVLDEQYFDLGDQPPYLTITASGADVVRGEYAIGFSTGSLDGALREFGGETIVIVGYAGMDEMDPNEGAGRARLTGPDTLEGEFFGWLGRFESQRHVLANPQPARRRR